MLIKVRMRSTSRESKVDCPPFRIESPSRCDCFQKGGFSTAVLANDESDVGMKLKSAQLSNRRDVKGIGIAIGNLLTF